jgi:hypothetical protein
MSQQPLIKISAHFITGDRKSACIHDATSITMVFGKQPEFPLVICSAGTPPLTIAALIASFKEAAERMDVCKVDRGHGHNAGYSIFLDDHMVDFVTSPDSLREAVARTLKTEVVCPC